MLATVNSSPPALVLTPVITGAGTLLGDADAGSLALRSKLAPSNMSSVSSSVAGRPNEYLATITGVAMLAKMPSTLTSVIAPARVPLIMPNP